MKIREQAQAALEKHAKAIGATKVEVFGEPTEFSPSTPFLLVFRTEFEILHASVHWDGFPVAKAEKVAPTLRVGRTDFAHEIYEYSGDNVRIVKHGASTKEYRRRNDLPAEMKDADGWTEKFGSRYIRFGGKTV